MKKTLKDVEEGLYMVDIFIPTDLFLEKNYCCETNTKHKGCSVNIHDLCEKTGIRCIVKIDSKKRCVREINTGLKLPILLEDTKQNINKTIYGTEYNREENRTYHLENKKIKPGYFTILSRRVINHNVLLSNIKSKTVVINEFLSELDNLFSYSENKFKEIMDNYKFGEEQLEKLKGYETKNKETLLLMDERKKLPKNMRKHIKYSDASKLEAYKKYIKKGSTISSVK